MDEDDHWHVLAPSAALVNIQTMVRRRPVAHLLPSRGRLHPLRNPQDELGWIENCGPMAPRSALDADRDAARYGTGQQLLKHEAAACTVLDEQLAGARLIGEIYTACPWHAIAVGEVQEHGRQRG